MEDMASRTHCDNGGVTPSQDLADAPEGDFEAIAATRLAIDPLRNAVWSCSQHGAKITKKCLSKDRRLDIAGGEGIT